MIRFLIVDDEEKIREVVKEYAKVSGFECLEASSGKQAIEIIGKEDIDLVVLDIMMPELDGFSACKKIKELKDIPIIMLSARQDEEDKLYSFELGVDDYVTKPFSPKELMARIKAVSERKITRKTDSYIFGGLKIDIQGRVIYVDSNKLTLTPKEFDLLVFLVENRGKALLRDTILNEVWDIQYEGDLRTVDTHIKMLRNDLGPYRDYVETVRGIGYKFEA